MMRSTFFWLLSFGGLAAVSFLCGLLVWPQLSAAWPSIEEKIDRFRRLPPLAKLLLLLFVGIFVVFGSTKPEGVDQATGTNIVEIVEGGTNDVAEIDFEGETNAVDIADGDVTNTPPMMLMTAMPFSGDQPQTVTPEDIARGWQLWEVRTNCNVSYTMPEGATLASNWWVRGAYEDVKLFDFGSWRFPFGTNEYDSVWAFSWGELRFVLGDAESEIAAVGAPMSAVPYRSRLWSAADANGARLVTWENFVLGRTLKEAVDSLTSGETPLPLCCAQIELRENGDFITRSNEVETVYRRVDPEDWDGDGWRNDDDNNPYSWNDCNDDFYQELPEGADPNAYCWIEVRPEWNTWIDFQGDDWSYLPDPNFTARAGRTYRVWLLIGKTYSVHAPMPVSVVGKSDDRIEITDVTENSFTVVWPVTFTVAEGRAPTGRPRLGATWNDGGKSFYVMPNPSWLRGAVTWTDNYCCDVWGDGTNFTYACDNTCTCEGCTVYGSYWYEGYGLPVWGIPCGCHYVPDQGPVGVSISFDRPAVIYEDAYTNLPDVVVHPVRSNAVLRCSVSGGTYGGTFSVTLNAAAQQKLRKVRGNTLPQNVRIEPGSSRSYEVEYSVLEPSGSVGDIGAEARFLEDFHNKTHTNNASMTAVKVELTPDDLPPLNPSLHRHIFGIAEKVHYSVTPSDAAVEWSDGTLDGSKLQISDGGTYFFCPWTGGVCYVVANIEELGYRIPFTVYEPELDVRNARLDENLDAQAVFGEAGWLGMDTDIYVKPFIVSFLGVYMEEIPVPSEDAIPLASNDYFAVMTNVLPVTHNGNGAGAGKWRQVHYRDNRHYWTSDHARMPYECPPLPNSVPKVWLSGTMRWHIPVGWGDVYGEIKSRIKPDPTDQVYEIEPDGALTIRKFEHSVKRTIDGRTWLDGAPVYLR